MDKNKLKVMVLALVVACVAILAYALGKTTSPVSDPHSPAAIQRQADADAEVAADAAEQAAASARKAADSTKKTSESAEVSARVTAEAAKASAALTE